MPSRFPGVDPYVELSGRWLGFHNVFMAHCSEMLNAVLPPHYAANVDERVQLVESRDDGRRRVVPDAAVTREPPRGAGPAPASGSVATLEPATLTLPMDEEVTEWYVDIVELPGRELITSIELLSPSNKDARGRALYLAKRRAMFDRGINLVEIDLLLDGERLETIEPLPRGDYYAFVNRANRLPKCDVYAWSIRRTLPKIPIPLKPPDGDVLLDLSAVFDTTFDGGRYAQTLPYDRVPPEQLRGEDRAWAEEHARAAAAAAP